MITLQEPAYAKINLTLDILGKREDGYHEVESVMQQITLCDDVEIDLETGEDWKVECDWEDVPTDSENLAWKAAGVFYKSIGKDPQGITIRITKRIPMGAGLAGGSADAAAVLRALNRHEGEPYTIWDLARLSAKVGSDVPFCVLGGTCLATGRGEILTQLLPMPQCFYCIAKPEFSVSTPELYAAFDQAEITYRPDNKGMQKSLDQHDLMHVAGYVGNIFEPLVSAEHPEIGEIKTVMTDCGASGVCMTGSGSAVYGIFDSFDMAAMASMQLMQKYKTYLSRNV